MSSAQVEFKQQSNLGIITLNRPESRNALTPQMIKDLGLSLQRCQSNDIRAVLITGTGNAFCSGADVKDFADNLDLNGSDGLSEYLNNLADSLHKDVILKLRLLNKPVIAAINGVAAGAGFSLTLSCDLRIASSDARFIMAYAGIGCTADGGSTYFLPRLVGLGRAMEIYLASQPIGAEYACELGLVNQVFPSGNFEQHALETAIRLSEGPTQAYGRVKQLFDHSWESNLAAQLDAETTAITEIGLTHDFQDGIKAFRDKRQAWFQGT
ncbi:MAG: enoyl-CoA hydratase-related protein [Chloroflexota bacterium]|nr:enoyl-CoA hydratase-related protein [Chloroflexota bacterium]